MFSHFGDGALLVGFPAVPTSTDRWRRYSCIAPAAASAVVRTRSQTRTHTDAHTRTHTQRVRQSDNSQREAVGKETEC